MKQRMLWLLRRYGGAIYGSWLEGPVADQVIILDLEQTQYLMSLPTTSDVCWLADGSRAYVRVDAVAWDYAQEEWHCTPVPECLL